MKKAMIILLLVVVFFGCELNPYIDRPCEVKRLVVVDDEISPPVYNLDVQWEQRGGLPYRESFEITQSYYETLSVGDTVIYSDILENLNAGL